MLDTIVIGAGFAGLIAARELSLRGRSCLVLEARDRLGGRVHTSTFAGERIELGGTWVHSTQPFVWAEIARYAQPLAPMPLPGGTQAIWSGGALRPADPESLAAVIGGLAAFCAPAAEVLPEPYDPLARANPFETVSVRERLEGLALTERARDTLDAIFATLFHGPLEDVAASEALRLFALAGFNPLQMLASVSGTKLKDGMSSLIEAIAADGRAEIRLSCEVVSIDQSADHVSVALRSG
ncbi:MAG: FAD-dependent oxidoreductase [Alphaproteobacteria bacterium]|nr:FAD-dependent oxidoreductase [Alphaproteobacteria bacterium]